MASDGTIIIDTRVDSKGLNSGITNMQGQFATLSSMAGKLAKKIAAVFAVKKIVNFGQSCIELGSDLAEVQNVVDTAFPHMTAQIDEFAKNAATTYGLSETMAKQYAGTFGAMAKSFGFAESESLEMSTALTGLAGDVASFRNITQDEAYTKLKSVFTGETESLKELGVVMTQTALDQYALANGYGKTTSAMTEQEKVALRYRFVMDQLSIASGDFAKTRDGWANQTRILKLQIDSLKASIGQGLINVLSPVLKVINTLLAKLVTLANAFKSFTELITGNKSSGGNSAAPLADTSAAATDAAESINNVADATDNSTKATKAAAKANKQYLSGLDEIRTFTKDDDKSDNSTKPSTSNPAASAASGAPVDFGSLAEGDTILDKVNGKLDGFLERLRELKNLFAQGFQLGFGDSMSRIQEIKDHLENIRQTLKEIFTSPEVSQSINRWADSIAYNAGLVAGSMASVGVSIATNLVGGIDYYLTNSKDYIKDRISGIFDASTGINNIIGQTALMIQNIASVIAGENGQKVTGELIGIFSDGFLGVEQLATQFARDVLDLITGPFIANQEKIKQAIDGSLGVIGNILETIHDTLKDVVEYALNIYNEHIAPLFESLKKGISDILGRLLDGYNQYILPVLERLAAKFEEVMKDHVQPMLKTVLDVLGKFADFVRTLWETILQPLFAWIASTIMPVIAPIIEYIGGVILGALAALADAINFIFEVIGTVIDIATDLIGSLGDVKNTIVDFVKHASEKFGELKTAAKEKFEAVRDKVTDTLTTAKDKAAGALTTLRDDARKKFESFGTNAKTTFGNAKTAITSALSGAKSKAADTMESLRSTAADKFDSVRSAASSAFGKIEGYLGGAFENGAERAYQALQKLPDVIKAPINGMIRIMNACIDAAGSLYSKIAGILSKLQIKIPTWVPVYGGKVISFNFKQISWRHIPELASGAVIPPNKEFLAVLGDQKSGNNIETPEKLLRQIVREESGNGNSGGQYQFTAQINRRVLFDEFVAEAKLRQQQTGQNPLTSF